MHSGQSYVHIHRKNSPHVNLAPCCSSKTGEGKLSHSSPPPSFALQLIPFLAVYLPHRQLYICTTYQSVSQAAQITQVFLFSSLDRCGLFTQQNATDALCYKLRMFKIVDFRLQTVLLCVVEQYQDSRASLVASDWASGLICIIRFSQLWNSFDLPPSLVTEWDRVSLLPPLPLTLPPLSSNNFTVLHVHHLFPWYPNPSIAHIVVILCSSALIYFNLLPSISFHRTSSCTRLIRGVISRRRQPLWF